MPRWCGTRAIRMEQPTRYVRTLWAVGFCDLQNTVSPTDGHSPVTNPVSMSVEWVDVRVRGRRYTSIQLRHYCKCRAHTQSNCFCLLRCHALTAVKKTELFIVFVFVSELNGVY